VTTATGEARIERGTAVALPGDLRTTWLIARRAAAESVHDRMTTVLGALWSLAAPLLVVLFVIRPVAIQGGRLAEEALPTLVAGYLLGVGLMPASVSIGIACGLFAGEKEQGNLLPLLATPATNRAIFAGKVLGAVLPGLLYAAIAEVSYVTEIRLFLGASTLRLMPLALSVALVALVPADTVLEAAVASLVSSRVRTYQSAQMLSGLALFPVMGALFALAFEMQRRGVWIVALAIASIVVLDGLLILVSAATWRREEVLARR
jgi:ABC-type Na+ efflux pump permease subunit